MWVVFVLSALGFSILSMILFWIGNKVFLSIKKSNIKFEEENNVAKENKDE